MENKYPEYCVEKCPMGKLIAQGFLSECEDACEAAARMKNYVEDCLERGCPYGFQTAAQEG